MAGQSKTILVLEDERSLRGAIKARLETVGFQVMAAKSTDQALDYLENGQPVDAVWLDHYLFGKRDGLDFVTKLKQDGSDWQKLPIFVISNTVSPDKLQFYLQLGVQRCYTKVDYRLDQIVGDITRFLEGHRYEST